MFVALLPLLLAIVLAELADGTLDAKSVAVLGVLAACGCALRLPGGVSGFEPVFFLLIPAGRVLGRGFGFVLGALTLFASALITGGVGPWLPFQMFGAAWVGFFAGCLPPARGRRELVLLAGYGFVAGLAYGLLLDLWFWPYLSAGTQLGPVPGASLGENLHRFVAYHLATAMGWDLVRALTNAVLVLVAGAPVLAALRRAARRAAFGAPVTFGRRSRRGPTAPLAWRTTHGPLPGSDLMADLITLKFDEVHGAQAAMSAVRALEELHYAWIDDVAIVEKHKGGRIATHSPHGSVAAGAWLGALVGLLLFFWFPPAWFLAGWVGGGAIGGLIGKALKDAGMDDKMIESVKAELTPDSSMLVLIGASGDADQMARAFEPYKPVSVNRHHIDDQTVENLKAKFADVTPPPPPPGADQASSADAPTGGDAGSTPPGWGS